ncbi:MAG: protein serine/threonine phosphatase [Bacteroidetes bacterium]|nr:protein serine/threonine phosphatase [Bacteroidota bacterium]
MNFYSMLRILFLLFISTSIFCQNNKFIDSLKKLATSSVDSVRFAAYSELAWETKETDKNASLEYSTKLYNEALNSNDQKWIAQGLNDIGIVYLRSGDMKKALTHFERSLAIRKKLGNKKDIASSLSKIANIKTDNGQYGEALELQLQTLRIYEELNILPYMAQTYNNIGQLYTNLNNFKVSNQYLKKAYDISRSLNDVYTMPVTLSIMGSNFGDLGKIDSAIICYIEAKKNFKETEEYSYYATACNNLGHLYRKKGDSKNGEASYQEAIAVSRQIGDSAGLVLYENNLANVLMDRGEFAEAEKILLNSLKVSENLGLGENVLKITQSLTGLYILSKDSKKAKITFDRYRRLQDSVYSVENSVRFSEAQTKFDVEKKDLELAKNKAEIEMEKNKKYITYGALAFFILLFSVSIWAFIQKRKNAKLLEVKNNQLEGANRKISHQKEELIEKQKEILDSIYYAKKIQNALLASEELLMKNLVDHFILFKPKDIVSGDFTWATIKDNKFYLACCDSTGHGVPGAFMSLLNIGFISEAIKERNIEEPGQVFNYVRERLIETIGNDDQKDGFDGILLCMDIQTKKISYAAANNSPLLVRNKELVHLKGNKMPVGEGIKTDSFETFSLTYEKGDKLYLYTDGYPDQFGGSKGKKLKYKQLEEMLSANSDKPTNIQKENLDTGFESWRGSLEQVDDVCVIGICL